VFHLASVRSQIFNSRQSSDSVSQPERSESPEVGCVSAIVPSSSKNVLQQSPKCAEVRLTSRINSDVNRETGLVLGTNRVGENLIDFEGWRHGAGYELADSKVRPKVLTTARPMTPNVARAARDGVIARALILPVKVKRYTPAPELYLKFANIEAEDEAAIVRFANEYGLLNSASYTQLEETLDPEDLTAAAEPIAHWRAEISAIKEAIGPFSQTPVKVRRRYFAGQFLDAVVRINGRLSEVPLQLRIMSRPDEAVGFAPRIKPQNLLALLWAQLYQSLLAGRTFLHCRWCGDFIEFTPAPGRAGRFNERRHCSVSCRVMANHGDRALAVRLTEQGLSPGRIVARLKEQGWKPSTMKGLTPVEQIQVWTLSGHHKKRQPRARSAAR
jgi:hypothetical protein